MTRVRPWAFLLAIFFVCLSSSVSAQSTGTGSVPTERTLDNILTAINDFTPGRIAQDRDELLTDEKAYAALQADMKRVRARQLEHRSECRAAIRRANRDTIMQVTGECYRNELVQEMGMLRKAEQYLSKIPLLASDVRSGAIDAGTRFIDAEAAIIDGIDTELFTSKDGLEQAKRNLHSQYRLKYRLALRQLEADRQLTWIVFVSKSINERTTEQGVTDDNLVTLETAALCLEQAGQSFASARQSGDSATVLSALQTGYVKAQECRNQLEEIAQKEQE